MTGLAGIFLRHATGTTERDRLLAAVTGDGDSYPLYCGKCAATTTHAVGRGSKWVRLTCGVCGWHEDYRKDVRG